MLFGRTALWRLAGVVSLWFGLEDATQAHARSYAAETDTYTVAVTALPEKLDPWHTTVGGFYYITSQLYHPLFERQAAGAPLVSQYLDMARTHACDRSMKTFTLCLREGVAFSNGEPIAGGDLVASLRGIHAAHPALPRATVTAQGDRCAVVALQKSDYRYFDRLTTSAHCLLQEHTAQARYPTGLGDYVVGAWSADTLLGVYRGDAYVDFPQFAFRRVQDLEDAVAQEIHDVNVMYWAPHKSATLASYRAVNHPLLRNYALVTAFADPEMGRLFAHCLDVANFRDQALQIEMTPTPGFLPRGVDGWRASQSAEFGPDACGAEFGTTPVVYISHMKLLEATTRAFFAQTLAHSRFQVEVRDDTIESAIRLGDKGTENVVYLLGFGTYSSEASFYGDPGSFYNFFLHHGAPALQTKLRSLLDGIDAREHGKHQQAYSDLHRALLDSGAVIGLGQHPPTLYYHPSIEGGMLSDAIMGYMKIASVRKARRP